MGYRNNFCGKQLIVHRIYITVNYKKSCVNIYTFFFQMVQLFPILPFKTSHFPELLTPKLQHEKVL